MVKWICVLALSFSFNIFASGKVKFDFDDLIEVDNGLHIHARVKRGRSDLKPILLLNGLSQDIDHWETAEPVLFDGGPTVIELDLVLQGRSLIKRLKGDFSAQDPIVKPLIMKGGWFDNPPVLPMVTVQSQANYVIRALDELGFKDQVHLLGLSYGGGLALQMAVDYPDRVASAILTAPYVIPILKQHKLIRKLIYYSRLWFPWTWFVRSEDLYDVILRGLVVTTYPSAEPEILKWHPVYQPYGAAELVRGIRHLDYNERLPRLRVLLHLVMAGDDKYILKSQLEEFWKAVPEHLRGSVIEIEGVEHKVNESVGPFLAAWTRHLTEDPQFSRNPGRFLGVPREGRAMEVNGRREISLVKAEPCEHYLGGIAAEMPIDRIKRNWLVKILKASSALFVERR